MYMAWSLGVKIFMVNIIVYLSVTIHIKCTLPDKCLSQGMCTCQAMMTLHFLNDVANDTESAQKIVHYIIFASMKTESTW